VHGFKNIPVADFQFFRDTHNQTFRKKYEDDTLPQIAQAARRSERTLNVGYL
jgi:hypothetical protein